MCTDARLRFSFKQRISRRFSCTRISKGCSVPDALRADMEGICRDEGRAVFVPGLLPGEEGLVRIVKEQKRFAFGRLMAPPATPSPIGVIPADLPVPAAVVAPAGICVYAARPGAKAAAGSRLLSAYRLGFGLTCRRCSAWSTPLPTATKPPCPLAAQAEPVWPLWRAFSLPGAMR